MAQIPSRIKLYLLKLGFQPNLKGYRLLARLIAIAEEGEEIMPLKYHGYKRLAEEFGVGEASVEKDIQNAISAAWLRGNGRAVQRIRRDPGRGQRQAYQQTVSAHRAGTTLFRKICKTPIMGVLFFGMFPFRLSSGAQAAFGRGLKKEAATFSASSSMKRACTP